MRIKSLPVRLKFFQDHIITRLPKDFLLELEAFRDGLFADAKQLADALEIKIKDFLFPVFVAIAGTSASLLVPITDTNPCAMRSVTPVCSRVPATANSSIKNINVHHSTSRST